MMKPIQERPSPLAGSELVVCEVVRGADFGCVLHHHPECEITLVRRGGSERLVGDRVTRLQPGDLVFLGPGLPHHYRNEAEPGVEPEPVEALVTHFLPDFPGLETAGPASLQPMQKLLQRAGRGLEVTGETRERAVELIEAMMEVNGIKRVILLLQLLDLLASSTEVAEICPFATVAGDTAQGMDRIGKACAHMEAHFAEAIYVEELAALVGLGKSAFSRLFKRSTGRSVPQHVNGLRIAHACRLLAETDLTVSQIARECGFVSPAHFQRQFRQVQQCAPLEYRARLSLPG
jgi:AraC-like DNA-binding protein